MSDHRAAITKYHICVNWNFINLSIIKLDGIVIPYEKGIQAIF